MKIPSNSVLITRFFASLFLVSTTVWFCSILKDDPVPCLPNPTVSVLNGQSNSNLNFSNFSHQLNFTGKNFCLNESEKLQGLAVFVFSSPDHFDNRNMVRSTWLNYLKSEDINGTYAFLIGTTADLSVQSKITEESRKFNDILQYNLVDAYSNLTYKTLAALTFLDSSCRNATFDFILKADDDMFANIPKLVSFARQHAICGRYQNRTFFCHDYRSDDTPHRNNKSKWFVPETVYPEKKYAPYCAGPGYMFTKDLVGPLLESAQSLPFLYLEDVFLGLCSGKAGNVSYVRFPTRSMVHTEQKIQKLQTEYKIAGDPKKVTLNAAAC